MEVGFVGLGAMGLPMTRHLVDAGHTVTVASRSRTPIDRAVALGAVDGGSPSGVAAAAKTIFLCVPNSPQVVEVVAAMLSELGPDHVVVDCSTIDPDVARAQHALVTATGAGFLDAPLSGGTAGAEAGTLTVMVGGDDSTLNRARPVLDAFAGRIVHVGGPGMGQVVKLCNNLIYAAQMLATSEATALALKSGVDLTKLLDVLTHATGDCVAVRTRLPVAGVVPDSPASNGWRPGFMTDLMAKDLDLALAYGAQNGVPLVSTAAARQMLTAASVAGHGTDDFSSMAEVVFALSGIADPGDVTDPVVDHDDGRLLLLAADHRARGVRTVEHYGTLLSALGAAVTHCDGILATAQPLGDLAATGSLRKGQRTYLSLNRTGLAGAAFELDDRLVATVDRAAADGWTGVKVMTRIAFDDPGGADALVLLGQVLEDAHGAGLEVLVEPVVWRNGTMSRAVDDVVLAAVIAHDLGSPLLKVPVPDTAPGEARSEAVDRVVSAVGVPVLFLGGPRHSAVGPIEAMARDVMAGGGGGLAVGRAVIEDPDPGGVAALLAGIVHSR